MQDQNLQKEILLKIRENGGQISVGALGERLGSKVLSGVKSGIDNCKHNLQLLIDAGDVKETGENLGITSGVRITAAGEEKLNSLTADSNDVANKSDAELMAIIRRAENTYVSGSLYHKANNEWQMRQQTKMLEATQNKKGGVFFEVGGDMINDGIIHTGEGATVDVAVAGDYTSKKGKIIQGNNLKRWWETSWFQGIALVAAILGIIGFFFLFK
jgi:hypothetical protein